MKFGLRPYYSAEKVITIGDIHSGLNKLKKLCSKILPLSATTHLVFSGDYIDRGNDFFEVLDFLMDLKSKYPEQVFFIEGNHEKYFKEFLHQAERKLGQDPFPLDSWLKCGGDTTLAALSKRYGTENSNKILNALKADGYWSFFVSMIPYYENESILVTHAPIRGDELPFILRLEEDNKNSSNFEGVLEDLKDKTKTNFMKKESEFKIIEYDIQINKILICGHQSSNQRKPRIIKNRVFLDVSEYTLLYAYQYPQKTIISSA